MVVLCVFTAGMVELSSGTAWAHNTLLSSDPSDGAELSVAPERISWVFTNAVPLESMTVTLIDASGVRSELTGSAHGAAGETEVVTPLPPFPAGPVSLRWRLVGPDGHPITGRVDFTVAPPAPAAGDVTATTAVTVPGATLPPSTSIAVEAPIDGSDADSSSISSLMRWILRYASYLAIMAVVGIMLTSAFVWTGAGAHPVLRRILGRSLFATAGLGFLQLLVVASDIGATSIWSSLGSIDAATATDAGMAFAIRIALALSMWLVLFRVTPVQHDVYWTAVAVPSLALLGTWAFAGHARSMRWPTVGVVTDVAHHAAAAAWIAGLAIVGWIVIPRAANDDVATVRRFSRLATVSVVVLVATGIVQSVRLVGSPMDLLAADHGRYLAAKIVVLAVMLGIANANRRRVDRRLDESANLHNVGALRHAVFAEFVIGLVIVAITAAMVVSPPSTNRTDTGAPSRTIAVPHQTS